MNAMPGFSRDKKNNPAKSKIITSNVLAELHFIFHTVAKIEEEYCVGYVNLRTKAMLFLLYSIGLF